MATPVASQSSSGSVAASSASNTPTTGSIALKIRTLDQNTYPIVISSDASVPQLKEIVATETGVVLARQRLIFRGKVLKNDQNIAAYALEDGHVLHLVVRAEEAEVQQTIAQAQAQRDQTQQPRHSRPQHGPPRGNGPLNNDEPDPMLDNGQVNRVVMGATIAVPDDMPMPFLSSVLANFVNSIGSATATGGAREAALQGGDLEQRNREIMRRLRRNRHATNGQAAGGASTTRRRGRDGGEAGGTATEGASLTNSLGGNMLRQQAEGHLRRLENSLTSNGIGVELPELQPRQEENSAALNQDEGRVEENITQLRGAIERFGTRMDRLPSALREIGWYARHNQEAPNALVSSTVRAIDTLQNVGDSASAIARFARHVFLANSPDIPAPMVRFDSQGMMRASLLFPIVGPVGPMPGMPMPERTRPVRQQSRGSPPVQDPPAANDGGNDNGARGVLHSLYQRVTSGLLGRNSNDRGDGNSAAGQAEQAASTGNSSTTARQETAHEDEGDDFDHIFITATANPSFQPIFPLSFSGDAMFPAVQNQVRVPEWNVAALWERMSRDLRAATAFGVLGGDPVCLYDLMRSLATLFITGAYTPPLTSTPIRTWARRLLIAVRRVLGEQTIPSHLLNLTPDRDATRFIEEMTRPFDPFMPELVDHIRRASSASQGDVFGRSCTEFFRNMTNQFLTRIRTYMNGDDGQTKRLLEGILMTLDVDATLAAFVVSRLVEFASPSPPSTRARTEDSAAPEAKRRRVGE